MGGCCKNHVGRTAEVCEGNLEKLALAVFLRV